MSNEKLVEEIIKSARLGDPLDEPENQFKTFGLDEQIVFDGERFPVFEGAISKLYESNLEIASTFSRGAFEQKIVEWLRPAIVDGKSRKKYNWQEFERDIVAIPKGVVKVFRAVHGVTLDDGFPPLKLGPFTLWSVVHHRSQLAEIAPKIRGDSWGEANRKVLIGVEVGVRDSRRALEIADEQFEMFEQFISFFLERDERYEVGVLNYRGASTKRALMETEVSGVENLTRVGPRIDLNLSQTFFTSPSNLAKKIWNLCERSNSHQMARRTRLAISWLGQACMESHLPTAFVKAAISLEILLGHSEKDIISSSILAHISECVALIIGTKLEDRLTLEKEVKRLYGQRSKIVHEGRNVVNIADLRLLLALSKKVVREILVSEDMAEFKDPVDLFGYLKRRKYGAK